MTIRECYAKCYATEKCQRSDRWGVLMKDRVCGCPITPADVAREVKHLRADLKRLDDEISGLVIKAESARDAPTMGAAREQADRLRDWRHRLAKRIAELEAG